MPVKMRYPLAYGGHIPHGAGVVPYDHTCMNGLCDYCWKDFGEDHSCDKYDLMDEIDRLRKALRCR